MLFNLNDVNNPLIKLNLIELRSKKIIFAHMGLQHIFR